ncbi:CatB-related O-acetyltransferase [Vibrio wakamikoensis]
MHIKITNEMLTVLERIRVYFRPFFHFDGALGKTINVKNKVIAEEYSRIPEVALSWNEKVEIGAFSYVVQGCMLEGCIIGRFCSIATGTRIMSDGHPLDRITTSTITYGENVFNIVKKDFDVEIIQNRTIPKAKNTIIGHDVWIGENSTIKRGVTIGTGSIVAANSLVVKDVPPYAVVGGNPAKIIKFRFDETKIQQLLKSKWWDLHPKSFSALDLTNIDLFLTNQRKFECADYKKYDIAEIMKECLDNDLGQK